MPRSFPPLPSSFPLPPPPPRPRLTPLSPLPPAQPLPEEETEEAPPPSVWVGGVVEAGDHTTDALYKRELCAVKPPPVNAVLCGAPASGKGTVAEKLVEAFGSVHISTGDMLRAAMEDPDNEDGQTAKQCMAEGVLVPDSIVISLVKARLSQPDCKERGWLLDGFPRTAAQAEEMDRLFLLPDKCVILDVPKDVLVERVTGRRTDPETGKIYHLKFNPPKVDPDDESEEAAAKATADTEAIVARLTQREDDTEEALAKRLEAFDSNRAAIEDAFSAMAKVVDGNRAKDDVWGDVKAFFTA